MKLFEFSMQDVDARVPASQTVTRVTALLHEPSAEYGYGLAHTYPAVVVLPGGGYAFTSDREAEPIAMKYFGAGYSVFILRYSVTPDVFPQPLYEACALLRHIRKNAETWHIRPNQIAVCGFSAGGHLAASTGTMWKDARVVETLGGDARLFRPDGMILSYAVMTRQLDLLGNALGTLENPVDIPELSCRVDAETPPAFLWGTYADALVDIRNTLDMGMAMKEADVPFEMHIYPDGPHGLALGDRFTWTDGKDHQILPHMQSWMPLSIRWLDDLFGYNQNVTKG